MNEQRLVTMRELIKRLPFSRGHVYRLIREGKFPAPIKLGDRRVAWLEHEVEHGSLLASPSVTLDRPSPTPLDQWRSTSCLSTSW